MKLISIFILSLVFTGNKPEISVSKQSKRLTWSDFKIVKVLEDASAETSTEISYNYEETNGKASIKIYCSFDKKQSFVVKGKQTAYLLNHEQRHLDISHIFAKVLYNRFIETENLTEDSAKNIYNATMDEWNTMQDEYDSQTEHSINKNYQQMWDSKIDALLKR